MCTQRKKREIPTFDTVKSASLAEKTRKSLIAKSDATSYQIAKDRVIERISTMPDPLDAVSGKDFLIPLLMFCIKQVVNTNISRDSFILRLAKHCSLEKLENLKRALVQEIARYSHDAQQTAAGGLAAAP